MLDGIDGEGVSHSGGEWREGIVVRTFLALDERLQSTSHSLNHFRRQSCTTLLALTEHRRLRTVEQRVFDDPRKGDERV